MFSFFMVDENGDRTPLQGNVSSCEGQQRYENECLVDEESEMSEEPLGDGDPIMFQEQLRNHFLRHSRLVTYNFHEY